MECQLFLSMQFPLCTERVASGPKNAWDLEAKMLCGKRLLHMQTLSVKRNITLKEFIQTTDFQMQLSNKKHADRFFIESEFPLRIRSTWLN